jgi:hypothetical protein
MTGWYYCHPWHDRGATQKVIYDKILLEKEGLMMMIAKCMLTAQLKLS